MTALVLDAGALIAVDRNDRNVGARLIAAEAAGFELRTTAVVVAEAWRDSRGRQALLSRLLRATDVRPVDLELAQAAGQLIGRAGTSDPIDATLVLVSERGDEILTSDPGDIGHLVRVLGRRVDVLAC